MPEGSRTKTDFAVHLDGTRLQPEESAAILGIRVFQTRSGASAFEVVVSDPDLKWQSKPTFTDCKEVKIELGEPGKLKRVFDGEVTAWRTELERSGPSVLVLRGLDRSHRLMRAKKTKTYANATPLDCAKQIAADHGLTAKTRAGSPTPVKMFRFQANQTDFEFLRAMADLEGYMFFIEGNELHFERPSIPTSHDAELTFGEDVKNFLPKANFRRPPAGVEVGAWDVSAKSEVTGKAKTGDEIWSIPGGKPGAELAKFTSSKPEIALVESQVGTQEHADTVAKAALTRRAMEFLTAEVEVQGNPVLKPGALVNIKKVGPYSGHYLVTEANHFYDAAGYNCIFYVARDKWGNSSQTQEQAKAAKQQAKAAAAAKAAQPAEGAKARGAGTAQPGQAKAGAGAAPAPVAAAPPAAAAPATQAASEEPGAAEAATLAAASAQGVPFCEECEQARRELEEISANDVPEPVEEERAEAAVSAAPPPAAAPPAAAPPSAAPEAPAPHGVIDSTNADTVLEPGDVLIKFAGGTSTFTEKVIQAGEQAVKKLSGLFHDGIKKGDPTCFHVALYLGEGRTAEAHGGSLSTALVGTRSIDAHEGFLFRVYRCQDRALAEAAVKVADTWANQRMRYLPPVLVPFRLSSFGPRARGEALIFGQESGRTGGPQSFSAMFCSQFVIAVYQAAAVATQLRAKPGLLSTDVRMPEGLDLHASNSSPLAFHAKLEGASATWRYVDEVLVRPQQDANAAQAPAAQAGPDVTGDVQVLGNPTEQRWPSGEWIYARNPWSLRAFEGKIYVGSGNSNNPPPASNAGPVDLWTLDARSGTFPKDPEYEVRDEQVDVFRVLSDGLWIPGHDARVTGRNDSRVKGESKFEHLKRLLKTAVAFPADWAAGNLHHRLAADVWETLPYIPNGIHVYDVFEFGGELFAAVATVAGGMVARSRDRGRSWKEILTKPFPYSRTRTLFALDDDTGPRLYASTNGGRIYRYDGKGDFAEMNVRFFPGIEQLDEVFAARPTEFRRQVVYIAGRKIIDHDWAPLGLFAAPSPDSARALPLPGGALARDLVVHDHVLYVLASTQPAARSTRVHLFATQDLTNFHELCFFNAETFARSFETLDGDFYFGLGCDPELLHPHTGRILKVPAAALRSIGQMSDPDPSRKAVN